MKLLIILLSILATLSLESCQNETLVPPDELNDSTTIDSTLVYPYCIPETDQAGIGGCDNMFFYKMLIQDSMMLTVQIDPEQVAVVNECRVFSLPMEGISVKLELSKAHPDSLYFMYCDDVITLFQAEPIRIEAHEGWLQIGASIDSVTSNSDPFFISAKLTDLHFQGGNLDTLISQIIFYQKSQGWMPG